MIMNLDALNANEISRDCLIYLVHLGWLSKTKVWVFFHFVRLAHGKKSPTNCFHPGNYLSPFLNNDGDLPKCSFTYLPKKEVLGKPSWVEICLMLMFVCKR